MTTIEHKLVTAVIHTLATDASEGRPRFEHDEQLLKEPHKTA